MRLLAGISLAAVFLLVTILPAPPTPPWAEVGTTRIELLAVDGDVDRAQRLVTSLGGRIEITSRDRVQAVIPTSAMPRIEASRHAVTVARPGVFVPLQVVPSTTLIGADNWNAAGFTGYGVKVAILDAGFEGYESRLGGTLPETVVTQSFRRDGSLSGGTQHGRRAAEIVHTVAPGARLYLVNFSTVTELSAAVDYLIEEGVHAVSFSLGYIHNGPGDGTGPVNAIVSRGTQAGQAWAVASGNWAQQHWSGTFSDDDGDTIHEFQGDTEMNEHQFSAGDLITVSLRWDEPWGAACSDYDIELFGPSGALVRASRVIQNCDDDPVEALQVLATQTGTFGVRIIEANAEDGPRELDLMMVGTPDRGNALSHFRPQSSLSEPADHPRVITVGALTISASRTEAGYSSRGPTTDGRFKPNLLAPTGAGNALPSTAFGGTSAAAPHVAGALALLKEAFPSADADRLAALLQTRAVGVASTADSSGARRLDMGSLFGVGPTLPPGAEDARVIGTVPDAGISLVEYDGPNGYPARFIHTLVDFRAIRTIFAYDGARWRAYSTMVPSWVNSLTELDDGQEIYIFFDPFG